MTRRALFAAAAILASVMFVGAAQATPLNFHFVGTDSSTLDFTLDSMPTPDFHNNGIYTGFEVTGLEDGVSTNFSVDFYALAYLGGFTTSDNFASAQGLQIYAGTEANPIFAPGTFLLSPYEQNAGGTLTISPSPSPSPVPEPGIFGMFCLGLLGVTVLARKK
jgi:hypothetical protein